MFISFKLIFLINSIFFLFIYYFSPRYWAPRHSENHRMNILRKVVYQHVTNLKIQHACSHVYIYSYPNKHVEIGIFFLVAKYVEIGFTTMIYIYIYIYDHTLFLAKQTKNG